MTAYTITVHLQDNQVDFAKTLLLNPATWEQDRDPLLVSMLITELNRRMYLRLAESDPAAVESPATRFLKDYISPPRAENPLLIGGETEQSPPSPS
jgi:hypothetical protein